MMIIWLSSGLTLDYSCSLFLPFGLQQVGEAEREEEKGGAEEENSQFII